MARALLVLALVGLTVYTLIDCARTPAADVRNLPKALWLLLIVVLPVVGPVGWLLAGRQTRRQPPRAVGRGPVGPDDDPDFLRRVEEQRRLQRWEKELRDREQRLGRDDEPGDGS